MYPGNTRRIRMIYQPSTGARVGVLTGGIVVAVVLVLMFFVLSPGAALGTDVGIVLLTWAAAMTVILRSGVWLRGGTLTRQTVFGAQQCDLASSAVRIYQDPGRRIPVLSATDGQHTVNLQLVIGRRPMSPRKLTALADAIVAGGRQDPAGWEVAGQLRAMSGGPAEPSSVPPHYPGIPPQR